MGIVIDREFDFELQRNSIKVHFYEFPERWDEWYTEENLSKVAPFGSFAEEPKDKIYAMTMTHRKVINNEATNKTEMQAIGMPFYISIGSWFTWEETYMEVVT
jgi:hypothetical protein